MKLNKLNLTKLSAALLLTLNVACEEVTELQNLDTTVASAKSEASAELAGVSNSAASAKITIDVLHNKEYDAHCSTSQRQQGIDDCERLLDIDPTSYENNFISTASRKIFFREWVYKMNGQIGSRLQIWKSQKAYENCGLLDLSKDDVTGIQMNAQIVEAVQVNAQGGSNFTIGAGCEKRHVDWARYDLENLHTEGFLSLAANNHRLDFDADGSRSVPNSPNCTEDTITKIAFYPQNNGNVVMQFVKKFSLVESVPGGCNGVGETEDMNTIVLLKKQNTEE